MASKKIEWYFLKRNHSSSALLRAIFTVAIRRFIEAREIVQWRVKHRLLSRISNVIYPIKCVPNWTSVIKPTIFTMKLYILGAPVVSLFFFLTATVIRALSGAAFCISLHSTKVVASIILLFLCVSGIMIFQRKSPISCWENNKPRADKFPSHMQCLLFHQCLFFLSVDAKMNVWFGFVRHLLASCLFFSLHYTGVYVTWSKLSIEFNPNVDKPLSPRPEKLTLTVSFARDL